MLSKRNLIDLFIESASGGVAPDFRKWHPTVVSGYMDIAINALIAQEVKDAVAVGIPLLDNSWVKTFNNIVIKWDKIRKQCYAVLPVKVIFMYNNRGLVEVGWMEQDGSPNFVIQDGSSYSVISQLECSYLEEGVFFALVVGESLYFPEMPESYAKSKKRIMCRVVAASSGYTDDEVMPIVEEKASQVFMLVQQLMLPQMNIRNKVTNDSNPNTV